MQPEPLDPAARQPLDAATLERLCRMIVDEGQDDTEAELDLAITARHLAAALAAARERERVLCETLREAASDVQDYAQYAGEHLREKWHVAEDVARYRALAGDSATEPERPAQDG